MKNFTIKLISPLEKVFLTQEPMGIIDETNLTVLKNETLSFQLSYTAEMESVGDNWAFAKLETVSPLADCMTIRKVSIMPVVYAVPETHDDNYIAKEPGLYPDLLDDIKDNIIRVVDKIWMTLWVDVKIGENAPAGDFDIQFKVTETKSNEMLGELKTKVKVINSVLPKQTLIHTEWFHGDCLADYYETEPFSEKHWEILNNFIGVFGKYGINMILTPLFTPPLDTDIGGERTTIQLVDVVVEKGVYSFGFEKLHRWVRMCQANGVEYFEMNHLFSQWGAKYAIKVMATVDGEYKNIFGWDYLATSEEYKNFLQLFLPELIKEIDVLGIRGKTYFHISDEPSIKHLEQYTSAKAQVEDLLQGFPIIDALSSYEFYKTGAVTNPIPSNDHINHFIDGGVEGLWTYYCVAQSVGVSNRFMAMPSANNRIIATQLYKYKIKGFLHWGFNFYNSVHSKNLINPFYENSSDYGFPAGDPFLVYPGRYGKPLDSIRLMVFYHALQDLRAFTLLESLTSREHVMSIIESGLSEPIQFNVYPKDPAYLLALRKKINEEIEKLSLKQYSIYFRETI